MCFKNKLLFIENAEDSDVVMPMYNFFEYNKIYSKTSGSLLNYYRDELTNETNDDNFLNKNVISSEPFKYKTNITGSTYNVTAGNRGYNRNKEGCNCNCCAIKKTRQFLEQFKYTINQL